MRLVCLLPLALSFSLATPLINDGVPVEDALVVREDTLVDLQSRSLASSIWDAIEGAASCTACESVLLLLKGVAALGDKIFVKTIQDICKLSGSLDDDVCNGAVALEGPIMAHDLREMSIGSKMSKIFCTTFFGLCDYPDVTPYTVPFPSPKPSTGRPAPSGQTPIKVVHFSDIHVDQFYVPGSNANCSKPTCCRSYTTDDSPGHNDAPAGRNGDHKCDSPVSLEDSLYAAIKAIVPDAAFSLFTGDIVDHAVWNTTQAQNTIDIDDAYGRMAAAGLPLVYGTVGNHEGSPTNAFPPAAVGTQAQWVYDALSAAWTPWLGATEAAEAKDFGAYSVKYPGGNLKVVSLSTNLYYTQNYWLYEEPMERDPSGQLAWLVEELDASERAGERVYIVGHMPMGVDDAFHDGSNYFDQIVNRYDATIAAMFFGHTHVDHFEIHYSSYENRTHSAAVMTSYIAPSLMPMSGHPAFRVYDVDPVTFAVLDATTYIADMTDPSFQSAAGPSWTKYYSARDAYGPLVSPPLSQSSSSPNASWTREELSPAFWHNVTAALEADQAAFDAYNARKSRGWKAGDTCTGSCVAAEICALRGGRAQDNCATLTPGVHFTRRSEMGPGAHVDECGVSVSRATLGSLVVRREALEVLEERVRDGERRRAEGVVD
ncbi:Sphingomyelin phosphodiesterase [Pleurostoma richardsiae]|uniref:Sphingomyelin phosphodiesterase n=1 Tax=Pleurostoma richardsiae TaxID=41990 RepID=A0AA38VDT1_9PEZI|nr:Sphingomyelin phosphodiesterase [Pleurostoma richardsiae]